MTNNRFNSALSALRALRCWISAIAAVATLSLGCDAAAVEFVWLEGEQPARANYQPKPEGAGRPEFLSERAWWKVAIEGGQVEREAPAEGVLVDYGFDAKTAGEYEIWARIGYEFVRAPFDWRIDSGEWKSVSPDELTTDLMELSFWTEVAWLKLGKQPLAAGRHSLSFRLPRTKDAQGKPQRILFALDCVCLTAAEFHPYQFYKPGEEHQTDRDRDAAKHMFKLPVAGAPAARVSLPLSGLWEVCRHDEQVPGEVAAPIRDFPAEPRWTAIDVPGDKNRREDLIFAHRLWYRTRVHVPDSLAGRSMVLVFPANNLNTTIYVNGQYCGFDKNPLARLQFDVTRAVRPGVNELCVGIKDGWYGYRRDPADPLKLRRRWNLPLQFFSNGFQELVYPIWNQKLMGIVGTPQWIAAGPAYAADVFCKPSVADKKLGVEIAVQSSRSAVKQASLVLEAVNDKTGEVEKRWTPAPVDVSSGRAMLATDLDWENPKLWWPDEPNCYRLRTTVQVDGRPVDVQETLFGFRQWTCDGIHLRLNGVKWQGFTEHGVPGRTPEEHLASLKDPKFNYGFSRMWPQHGGQYKWLGQEPEKVLAVMDRGGALIRRTGYLDGEAAGYLPGVFEELGANWIDHLTAWIKGERNHPSIMIWSVENELNFINARNLGSLDKWEPVLTRAWEAIQRVDPTRPMMIDGGGATRAQTLPVHGDHYSTKPFWNYPQLAYEANADQREWTWDEKRPKFIGEELFAAGINPAYAYFGGEQVFLGKAGNRPAVGKAMQVISQGYRWFGIAACDFCQQPSDADGSQYNEWAPRAVLVRQWDYTFASGQPAKRTVGIFNNTRFAEPLTFAWRLVLDGREIAARSTTHRVPPGENEKYDVELPIPDTDRRLEGQWTLTLAASGKEVFRAVKEVSVLPVGPSRPKPPAVARLQAGDLFVHDPKRAASEFLKSHGIAFTPLERLTPPDVPGKVWLVGQDALSPGDTSSTAFAAYAAGGGRVLLLEQDHPLRYQGLGPAEVEFQTNVGRTAFAEDLSHPLLQGLQDKDFFTWEPGEVVYKNAYLKPQRGARSLVQCNESLLNSALLTIPVNDGLVTLCQLVVGQKLADNPTAQTLLLNALDYSAAYKLEFLKTAAAVEPALGKVLDSINLQYTPAADPLAAMAAGRIAVISAAPDNLKTLAANAAKVQAYHEAGGWLVLHGLTPEGLADFNRLVGFEHLLRPFRRERVTIAVPRNRLLAGVSLGDVALFSSERSFSWQAGNFVASDTFSFVVDVDDVAPFGTWDSDAWYNFVNGMVSADGWKYIQNHPAENNTYRLTLPKPQELAAWTWDGNVFYNPTRRVELIFDGDEAGRLAFNVPPDGEPATFDIDPPRTAKQIAIRHAEFDDIPEKRQNGVQIIGFDNVAFYAKRPADFRQRVRPLLNSGGLVEYPRGAGGTVLANLLFKDAEEVPINAVKKRRVLASILRNLGAPFGGGKTVIAGARLAYSPIDISAHATQYRTDRGWFGDARFTLKDLPEGLQNLAGVNYDIYEFRTSPVPTCIMLAGPRVPGQLPKEVKGIAVNRQADALFFLHTARIDRRRNEREKKEGQPFDIVRYVVHYADGQDEVVPILAEVDIDDYRVQQPQPLPGAQLAWTKPYEGTEFHAAVYAKQWNNPRPDIEIRSLDVLPGDNTRGTAALLAVTAALAE